MFLGFCCCCCCAEGELGVLACTWPTNSFESTLTPATPAAFPAAAAAAAAAAWWPKIPETAAAPLCGLWDEDEEDDEEAA